MREKELMHRVQNWQIRKPVAHAAGGVVASQSQVAAAAGAAMLAAGGNAVDAAVATGFALNACEPWMSGIGGGGYMLIYLAAERRVRVVDFPMLAPAGLAAADYPLATGDSAGPSLFPWPPVVGNRNNTGYLSVAVPGNVDGLGLALDAFGTMSLPTVMAPAIALAEAGLPTDWWVTLNVSTAAAELALFADSRRIYLPGGLPPVTAAGAPYQRIGFGGLADTLRRIADGGRRIFYEGDLARRIVADLAAGGSRIAAADLAGYRAAIREPLRFAYRDAILHLVPGLTGSPTLTRALDAVGKAIAPGGGPGPDHYAAYAEALLEAYSHRLSRLGAAGDGGNSCTSHITVADRAGNVVALTQTLLARFGSKVVLPQTDILMNNGIAWFNPQPGHPNGLAAGRQPLSNMSPLIATRDGQPWFALGASGGRRIVPAVMQLTSFLTDCGLDLEAALHQPRIDISAADAITYDSRLAGATAARLAAIAPAAPGELVAYPALYACPNGVARDGDGWLAATDVMSPHSGAAAA